MPTEERASYGRASVSEMKQTTDLRLRQAMGWRCAACERLITRASDGWVEWLSSEEDNGAEILRGLRLVHHQSCRYDARTVFQDSMSVVEGFSLELFLGPDGLILLLSLLAAGELPPAEVIELAKRVQVPGYELAHNLIGQGNLRELVPPFLGHGCYLQAELTELVAHILARPEGGLNRVGETRSES